MYMTRVCLKYLPAPNVIHSILSAAFPGKRSESANENLWRIDNLGDASFLIIVSETEPDLHQIVNSIGAQKNNIFVDADDGKPDKTIDYEPFLKRIDIGQIWNFRLCANPVEHKKQNSSDKRGKVYALRSIPEQVGWLGKQSAKYGFAVSSCSIIGDSWISFNKVRIRSVTFDGILSVTNADSFRSALTHGIGRGKAYGCGLITVAKEKV